MMGVTGSAGGVARLRQVLATAGLALAGALLWGCAAPPDQGPAVRQPGCTVSLAADVPYALEEGKMLVPASVNGVAARFVVDTGSSHGALILNRSEAVNRRLGVTLRPSRGRATLASGRRIGTDAGLADEVRVGNAILRRVTVATPADSAHFERDAPGDGILTVGFLSGFDVEFDPGVQRLRLHRVEGCGETVAPPFPVSASLPMQRRGGGLAFVPMVFDGRTLEALVDTGTFYTLVSTQGARRAGVSEATLRAAPRIGTVRDIIGTPCAVCAVEFDRVALGARDFRDIRAPVVESASPIEVFLGLDLLLAQRVWISFATGSMHLGQTRH